MSARVIKGFSILFFLALIATLVATLYVIRMKQSEQASRSFQSLIAVSENFSKTYATADVGSRNRLSQTIFKTLSDSRADFGVIRNTRGEKQLTWARSVTAETDQTKNDLYGMSLTSTLAGVGTLSVSYTLLTGDDLRLILLVALIALSGYSLILIFLAALNSSSKKAEQNPPEPRSVEHKETAPVYTRDFAATLYKNESAETIKDTQSAADVPDTKQTIETSRPIETNRPVESTKQVDARHETQAQEKITTDESDSNETNADGDQKSERKERDSKFILLDRKSGVSQERFLPFRLDKELQRSAENTVDISLVIIRFPNVGPGMHSEAATLLLSEFNHEDLIFEYGEDAFCVILTEHDLDQAIARMELFIRKADQKFTSLPLNANSPNPDERRVLRPTAGLTSRNGRIIDAKRFLKEASVALKKASHEEGRIVGFRPDPLRFRHFLRHQRV